MEERKNPFQWLINIWTVTVTLWRNMPRIWELARFEFVIMYRDSRLGLLWSLLSPITQIGVYWFVFGIGLRHRGNMGEYPYLVWMVCGLTAWNFISKAVLTGAGELRAQKGLISRISLPPYLLLFSRELALFFDSLSLTAVMFLIMLGNGWRPDVFAFNLLYYAFCAVCFAFASAMALSTAVLIVDDFRRFLQSAMRLMFFLTPILWNPGDGLPEWFYALRKFNPFDYIVWGYRNSLLYHQNFWENRQGFCVFWGLTLLLYAVGCQRQNQVRDRITDFM